MPRLRTYDGPILAGPGAAFLLRGLLSALPEGGGVDFGLGLEKPLLDRVEVLERFSVVQVQAGDPFVATMARHVADPATEVEHPQGELIEPIGVVRFEGHLFAHNCGWITCSSCVPAFHGSRSFCWIPANLMRWRGNTSDDVAF